MNLKDIFFQLCITAFIASIVISCDNSRVFDEYKSVPGAKWHKDSLIIFNIPVSDTLQNYNLIVSVRNEITYKYSNLWLFIEVVQPGGKAMRDTFEIALADASGKWLGEGLAGLKTRQVIYRRHVFFPGSGDYTIKIQHGMRQEILQGIQDIGFRVEKVKTS